MVKDAADSEARLLQAIADPVRLGIVRQLATLGAVCACDIAAGQTVSQPTVSHHLRVLRETGWISAERRGTWIWYTLRPEAVARLMDIGSELDRSSGARPTRLPVLRVVQPEV